MAEYIDRENFCKNICKCNKNGCDKSQCAIWKTPTADVEEVKHGEWVFSRKEWGSSDYSQDVYYKCSNCGKEYEEFDIDEANYCQHCGAKMDGGKEE